MWDGECDDDDGIPHSWRWAVSGGPCESIRALLANEMGVAMNWLVAIRTLLANGSAENIGKQDGDLDKRVGMKPEQVARHARKSMRLGRRNSR